MFVFAAGIRVEIEGCTPVGDELTETPHGPLQGDADCDDGVDTADGIAILRHVAGLANVSCEERAHTACDEALSGRDAQRVFVFLAGIRVEVPSCTSVGDELSQ